MAKSNKDPNSYAWSIARLGMGYIFLWAFIDKLFGLHFATCKGVAVGCKQAWLQGGSPTTGFLGHAAQGPFASFYHQLAGQMWVDWAFMLGLAFVGIGLLFGTWIKSAAVAGMVMLALMWSALLWPVNTPGVDDHIIYILVLFGLLVTNSKPLWTFKIPGVKLP